MQPPNPADIKPLPSPQPNIDTGIDTSGISDIEVDRNPYALESLTNNPNRISIQQLAYGGKPDIASIAYGGNTAGQTLFLQSARIGRLQRGVPRKRRGTLVPAIPRTKSQTIYARDPGQAVQNKVLNRGAAGVTASGTPVPGTSNQPNLITGAIDRYRTDYVTLIQPSRDVTVTIV